MSNDGFGELRLAKAEGIKVIGCSHSAGSIDMMFCSKPSESGQNRLVSVKSGDKKTASGSEECMITSSVYAW
jgi:hypothetical protein